MRRERFFGFMKPRIATVDSTGEIRELPPPDQVRIPLTGPGLPDLEPQVRVGRHVTAGQMLAVSREGAAVHTPVAGEVISIGPAFSPSGQPITAIDVLRSHEDEEWSPSPAVPDLTAAEAEDLIVSLASLGIETPWRPGAGIKPPLRRIVVMGIDREPGLTVQRRFLRERRDQLVSAMVALRTLAGATPITLAVPYDLAAELTSAIPGIEIHAVGSAYPENHWRLVLARIAGVGNLSIAEAQSAGIFFITAENLASTGQCMTEGLPRTTKLVTVQGKNLDAPVTVEVLLGTPIVHILHSLEIDIDEGDRIMLGGHWQGHAQFDVTAPVTLGTDGITILPAQEVVHLEESACINCGRCTRVCPAKIQVALVARFTEFAYPEEAYERGAHACIECGVCAYVCPAKRPVYQYVRYAIDHHAQVTLEAEVEAAAQ